MMIFIKYLLIPVKGEKCFGKSCFPKQIRMWVGENRLLKCDIKWTLVFLRNNNKEFSVWNFGHLRVLQVPLPHKSNKCADPVTAGPPGPGLPGSLLSCWEALLHGRLSIPGWAPALCQSRVGSLVHLPVVSLGTKGKLFMATSWSPRGILAGRLGL